MPTFQLATAYAGGISGATVKYGDDQMFDIGAALIAGGGTFTVTTPATLVDSLIRHPALKVTGAADPNPPVTTPTTHALVVKETNPQIGDVPQRQADGSYANAAVGSTVEAITVISAAGASYTIPAASGVYDLTLTAAALALTLPAPTAGRSFTLVLHQDGTGSRVVTWPACKWPGGATPTLTTTAGGVDVVSFMCVNGADWIGFPSGYDLR